MKNAALQRAQIENSLNSRIPAALTPRPYTPPERILCGDATIDALLCNGLAIGSLTELVGQDGSGRTTAALACMSAVTQAGKVCAWIDVADTFDPETAAACGVALERLLWVRCRNGQQEVTPASPGADESASSPVSMSPQPRFTGGGSLHPRSEGNGMPEAIGAMLSAHGGLYDKQVRRNKRSIGTPGAPNRPISDADQYRSNNPSNDRLSDRSTDREEQVNSDRLPPRRGSNLAMFTAPRCAEPQPVRVAGMPAGERFHAGALGGSPLKKTSPWKALDDALRITDLLLQAGGFSAIVLDLGSVPPEFAWKIPLATWFRFRAACERTRVSLLLLTQHPCARSSAETVVRLQPGTMDAQGNVMTGMKYRGATERSRSPESDRRVVPIRKVPQPERTASDANGRWVSQAAWVRTA